MRIRTGLLLVGLATAAPLLVFALLASGFVFTQERDSLVATAQARNRATLAAVDAELRAAVSVLRALSGAASLQQNDLEAFHRDSLSTLGTQPSWQNVVLQRPDGAQLTNARIPWGTPLPQAAIERASLNAAVATRKPTFANITYAPLLKGEPGTAVRLPIVRNGEVVYVLSAVLSPKSFQRVLEDQVLTPGWVSGLVGTDGRMVARVPAVPPGSLASTDYRTRIQESRDGWYRGKTIEGADTFTAYSRSDLTGWTIGYAMPSDVILGSPQRTSTLLGAGVLLSVVTAGAIAFWLSRNIARPMSALANSAKLLGAGIAWRPVGSRLAEVTQLSNALAHAAQAIAQRDLEIRRTHEELHRQAEALMRADANRARFLALLSHELRNFLAPLKAGLTLMERTTAPERLDQTRAMMKRQVGTMSRLIDDLIDVARIDRGELEIRLQRVDVDEVVRAAIEVARASFDAKHQTVVEGSAPDRCVVLGDQVRLGQVFANILTNASKYTPEGGHIEVSILQEAEHVVVTVKDSGSGFDSADGDRIFDMFVRLDPTREQHRDGMGIGLTVTKAIVDAHRGEIWASSAGPGLGATFSVRLLIPPTEQPASA